MVNSISVVNSASVQDVVGSVDFVLQDLMNIIVHGEQYSCGEQFNRARRARRARRGGQC